MSVCWVKFKFNYETLFLSIIYFFVFLFIGDKVQMIDFMIWPWFERFLLVEKMFSQMIVSHESLPNLHEWTKRMLDCPAVKKCMLPMEQHAEFLKSSKMGAPNYDVGLEE